MQSLLEMTGVQYTSVAISQLIPVEKAALVVFEIVLDNILGLDSLGMFEDYISNGLGLVAFGQYTVDSRSSIFVNGFTATGMISK